MAVKNILFILFIFFVYNDFQNQIMASGDSEIPEKFFGSFKLEKSENFDEFLTAKGINWFVRKMIQMSSVTKIFQKSTEQPGRYTALSLTGKGNAEYKNWALNEEFEAAGMDGYKHKITFGLQDNGETLTEKHIRIEQGNDEETYYYTRENDYLILRMTNNGITARRWFKLQAEKKK